jgi:hypothetical protein
MPTAQISRLYLPLPLPSIHAPRRFLVRPQRLTRAHPALIPSRRRDIPRFCLYRSIVKPLQFAARS